MEYNVYEIQDLSVTGGPEDRRWLVKNSFDGLKYAYDYRISKVNYEEHTMQVVTKKHVTLRTELEWEVKKVK